MSSSAAVDVSHDAVSKEDRVFRKVAFRIMPLMIVAYVISYIDRTNVGFAALTMNRDLGLTELTFGWGAGILFFSYCAFEVPSNIALHRFGARRWIARIMITWGLIAAATAFVTGPYGFYALRFLLGLAEAGFTPGVMYFFVAWFPARYRTRALSVFQMSVPLASLISGPLSSAILQMDGIWQLAGWQWLFIIEGLPAVVLGFVVLRYVTDKPHEATWLSAEEREIVVKAVQAEQRERPVHHLWSALADPRVLILAGIQFGFTIGSYAVGIWLPLILKSHGLSIGAIGLVAAITYLFGCIATLLWSWMVDRSGRRTSNLTIACMVGALGLIISVIFQSLELGLVGLSVALVGITSARGIFWSIPPRFLTGLGAAGGLAFINSIGTLGGFFGPITMGWLKETTGSFQAGLGAMAGFLILSAVLTQVLRMSMRQE
ncbi:MFS transporter [Bradyrhizobium iriomotense]|uniref:MFS transporter n=1 Tax=Bradyrhizobium iriomotense TaxID=441950 RepID=A0ABQ6B313_9BRAD|nr:MFS transporter [Bradyrhizobium iriomotense]GLR88760.1 MFS transporter [Bradyrhizobium iriomotense]